MSKINTALILAAGNGTRMRPLSNDKCKAMVKVDGRPLIGHMLERLRKAGINKAVVNVHAFADGLEQYLRTISGIEIAISDERDELLETGGAVVKALPLLGSNPVLICNIDAIWIEFENILQNMMKQWNPQNMDELFLLARKTASLGIDTKGDFKLLKHGRIERAGQGGSDYYYAGIEIFKPSLAESFPLAKFSRNKIWDNTFANRKAYGFVLNGFWMHVGDPKSLKLAEAVLKQAQEIQDER